MSAIFKANSVTVSQISNASTVGRNLLVLGLPASDSTIRITSGTGVASTMTAATTATFIGGAAGATGTGTNVTASNGIVTAIS